MLILKRALRCFGLAEALVPAGFALGYAFFATSIPVLGLILAVLVLCAFPTYLLDALRSWARGGENIGSKLDLTSASSGARVLIVLMPAVALVYLLRSTQPELARDALLAVCLFWAPAAVLVLALGDSIIEAVNPWQVLKAIGALGSDYLRVWVLTAVMLALAHRVGAAGPLFLHVYLLLLAATAATALLGAAAYGRREALRQEVDIAAVMDESDDTDPAEHEVLRRSAIIEREDGPAAALAWLENQAERFHAPPPVQHELLRLAAAVGRAHTLAGRGRQFVQMALQRQQPDEALRLASQCLAAVPDFSLAELEQDDALILLAQQRGRSDLVLQLARSFNANYPRYRRSVDHTVTAARLLIDRYGRPEEARVMLEDAIERGADGEQLAAVQAVLGELQQG